MIILIPFLFPYVKKEDAHDVLNAQRRAAGIILLSMSLVIFVMQSLVLPKVTILYTEFNKPLPQISQNAPIIFNFLIIGFVTCGLYLLLSKADYSKIDSLTRKYKKGAMIKTSELMDFRHSIFWILLVILVIGFLLTTLIVPIYSLTNQY